MKKNLSLATLLSLTFLFFTISCGGGSSEPAPSPNEGVAGTGGGAGAAGSTAGVGGNANSGNTTLYLRWNLSRTGTTVSQVSLSSFTSTDTVIPHSAGEYLLIASSGSQDIAAYPFKFFDTYFVEGTDSEGHFHTDTGQIPNENVPASITIPITGSVTRLRVMDPTGAVILETSTLSDGTPLSSLNRSANNSPAALQAIPAFPGISFITATDEGYDGFRAHLARILGMSHSEQMQYLNPTDEWKNYVIRELAGTAPRTRSAVTHIGFAQLPEYRYGSVTQPLFAITIGSVIVFNVNEINHPGSPGKVVHEVAHAYQFLLDDGNDLFPSLSNEERWTSQTRTLARSTLDSLGIQSDFGTFWTALHDDAQRLGFTIPYSGDSWVSIANNYAQVKGYAEAYGTRNAAEDIATMVQRIQYVQPADICEMINVARDNDAMMAVPYPYMKILLLNSAGFIEDSKLDSCFSDSPLRGDVGFHFFGPDEVDTSFNLTTAGYLTENGQDYFILGGERSPYLIQVRIKTRGRRPPLGLHRLANVMDLNAAQNAILIGHTGDGIQSRLSASGYVLLSSVTEDPPRAEGAFFFVIMKNRLEVITDYFPFGTFKFQR